MKVMLSYDSRAYTMPLHMKSVLSIFRNLSTTYVSKKSLLTSCLETRAKSEWNMITWLSIVIEGSPPRISESCNSIPLGLSGRISFILQIDPSRYFLHVMI